MSDNDGARNSPYFWRAFWITIAVLAVATLALILMANSATQEESVEEVGAIFTPEPPSEPREVPRTQIEEFVSRAGDRARQSAERVAPSAIDRAYAPVYAAIPTYSDFHYSVLGEYTELTQAAMGDVGAALEEKLFDGLNQRLEEAARAVETAFDTTYERQLEIEMSQVLDLHTGPLAPATRVAIDDAASRLQSAAPIYTVGAAGGLLASKGIAQMVGKKLLAAAVAKAGAKAAAKGTGVLGSAGVGAAAGAIAGPPGAVVGGIVGGVVGWFAVDKAVVEIDELLHREEFEAKLRTVIDSQKLRTKIAFADAIKAREKHLSNRTIFEIIRSSGK